MLKVEEQMELAILKKHVGSIRGLSRFTGRSRNTVRRYLRGGDEVAKRKPGPKRVEKLDAFKSYIVGRMKAALQCSNSQFNGTLQLTVNSGDQVQVHFEVISESNVAFSGTASASADPMISIDPTTLDPQLYSIILSDGVGNGLAPTTTPLPAAFPLFAGGLGFVGYLTRRKRRAQILAAVENNRLE